jgi:hypothetical protein
MAETEKLKFKVGLSGINPDKQPAFRICINCDEKVYGDLTASVNSTEYFEFEVDLTEGKHTLDIMLVNKKYGDTQLDENGNIINDLLLNIDSIEIDDIDLGTLRWTASEYCPSYPPPYVRSHMSENKSPPPAIVKNCINLGWNGKWSLAFESPFYIWLLENL